MVKKPPVHLLGLDSCPEPAVGWPVSAFLPSFSMGMLNPSVLTEKPRWVLCPVSALPSVLLEKLVPGRSPCSEQPSLLIKQINPDVLDAFVIVLEQSPGAEHRPGSLGGACVLPVLFVSA